MRLHLPDDWNVELDALERALQRPHILFKSTPFTPVVAAREILSWSEGGARRRSDRGRHDWGTLVREYRESLKHVGSNLHGEIKEPMQALARQLQKPKSYEAIKQFASDLLVTLKLGSSRGAAWDDLVAAARSTNYDDFCTKREVFLDAVRLSGQDLTSFGSQSVVVDVLADAATGVAIAGRMLGESGPETMTFDPMRRAGQTITDRMRLARRVWAGDVRASDNVVWLTYERAKLDHNGIKRVGRVSFIPCSRLFWLLKSGLESAELPNEVPMNRAEIARWCPEDSENLIAIAMIDAGRGPVGEAVKNAREICEATHLIFSVGIRIRAGSMKAV